MAINTTVVILHHKNDNRTDDDDSRGWIASFHRFLVTILDQMLDETPKIVLRSDADDQQVEAYSERTVLIPVFSQSFARSELLINGLRNYLKQRRSDGGLYVGDRPLVLKVYRHPAAVDDFFPELRATLNYNFYHTDIRTQDILEYNRFFGNRLERNFWMKLVDIAYDVYLLLRQVHPELESKTALRLVQEPTTVFLAEVADDLTTHRDAIKRELLRYGYTVLPEKGLPNTLEGLRQQMEDELPMCKLAVHLIGDDYGAMMADSGRSLIDWQNEIAAQYSQQATQHHFRRLIYVKPDQENISERQKVFVENLRSEVELDENAEIVRLPIQEFKTLIHTAINQKASTENEDDQGPEAGEAPVVYLITDKQDLTDSRTLIDLLQKQGYQVYDSEFEGDLITLRRGHEEKLRRCDGSIIYFGKAKNEWMRTKLQDILKAPGFGRRKPMRAKAVYYGHGSTTEQAPMLNSNTLLLGKGQPPTLDALKPFIDQMNGKS